MKMFNPQTHTTMKSIKQYICLALMIIGIGNYAQAYTVTPTDRTITFTGELTNGSYTNTLDVVIGEITNWSYINADNAVYVSGSKGGYAITSEEDKYNQYNQTVTLHITLHATEAVKGTSTMYIYGYVGENVSETITINYDIQGNCSKTPTITFAQTGNLTMQVGDIDENIATAKYNGVATGQVIEYSSNNACVTVHEGIIDAVSTGTATITATALEHGDYCSATASYTVTVTTPTVKYSSFRTHCNEYTLTYNGYTNTYSTSCYGEGTKLPEGATINITNCTPPDLTDDDRTFKNWNTAADGSGTTFASGAQELMTENVVLYAQWYPQHKVTSEEELSNFMETESDIVVKTGAKLTVTGDVLAKKIVIESGANLVLGGYTMAESMQLKGGYNTATQYDMPHVFINNDGTLDKTGSDIVNFDLTINKNNYYPFAVPFAVKVSDINYADPDLATAAEYGKHFVIKTYNGDSRAKAGTNNWVKVDNTATLTPGTGYIITAIPAVGKDYAVIRIPMTVDNNWTTAGEKSELDGTNRGAITVTAHNNGGAADKKNTGWNFIANPYMATYNAAQLTATGTSVPLYIQVPTYDFSEYKVQVLSENPTLPSEWGFFVQIGTDGTFNFITDGRMAQAPMLRTAAKADDTTIRTDIYLTNTDGTEQDRMGLVINDRYTTQYEIGADLERMFGEGYTLATYTVMQGSRLAFNALSATDAQEEIPVGFRAPEAGEYTFAINPEADMTNVSQIILRDKETGDITNLLNADYTFSVPTRTQCDTRFTLSIIPQQHTPTGISDGISNKVGTRKTFYNGHLYIIRDGKVFDATGKTILK